MKENNIKKIFAKYVSLNIVGMIGLSCYILADTFFVARGIGADGLTALNLAIPIYAFVNGTGLMLGMGGATRFTLTKSPKTFTQTVHYVALIGIIFVIIGAFFSEQIARLLGANEDTLQNAIVYLKVILWYSPMFLLNNVVTCFVRNDDAPKLAMAGMLIGSLSNIVLDYIFIFPCQMGMFGAAFATGIAPIISLLVLSLHFIKKKNTFCLKKQKPSLKGFANIASLGVSALITEVSSGIVIIVFNFIILSLNGNTGVAAYGIISNIALVIVAIFTGIAQGMQPLISLYYSEKRREDTQKIVKYGLAAAVSVAIIVYAITLIFAPDIVAAFNKENSLPLADIAINGMRIYFTAFAFVGANIISATYFSAVDNPKNAFIISFLRGFVVIVPAAFILSWIFGINGVWVAMPVSEFVVLVLVIILMKKKKC